MSSQPLIAGYCRTCGKALEEAEIHSAHGTIYCKEHAPMEAFEAMPAPQGAPAAALPPPSPYPGSPYTQPAPPPMPHPDVSPGVAFVLGFIPGVGAIYNGQYAKGLIHVVIIGLIISILNQGNNSNLEPLLGLMLTGFWAYMVFEAFHTAKKRRLGQPVDEFSSLIPMRGRSQFPVAPVILIALGVVFLLDNLGLLEIGRVLRYWPVLLIALGVYLLINRMSGSKEAGR